MKLTIVITQYYITNPA